MLRAAPCCHCLTLPLKQLKVLPTNLEMKVSIQAVVDEVPFLAKLPIVNWSVVTACAIANATEGVFVSLSTLALATRVGETPSKSCWSVTAK